MRAYSMDLRERVLADADAGMQTQELAAKYRVSPSWVRRLKQRRRERGEVAPRQSRNGRAPALAAHAPTLLELVARTPDATLLELRESLRQKTGLSVSPATLWRALRDLEISFKKKSSAPPSRIAPTWRSAAPPGGWR